MRSPATEEEGAPMTTSDGLTTAPSPHPSVPLWGKIRREAEPGKAGEEEGVLRSVLYFSLS